jgi:ABC-2 type transport system permease protein
VSGLGLLVRDFLRRDRWMLVWFTLGVPFLYWGQAYSVDGLYATQRAFDEAAAMMESNAGFVAMAGPVRALNTTGGQVTWQATAFGAIVVGLMSMFLVGRHTRAEEESGREELLRSGVVARRTPMTAAVVVLLVANLVVGLGVTASLVAYGLATAGAVSLGVGLFGCGMAFGALALLAMQLTASTRAAYGLAGGAIALAYALRAIGDVSGGVLSWFSPIGWYQGMHAYSGERWWPLLLLLGFAALVLVAAYAVFDRRDLGSGVLATRPGPTHASPGLSSGAGLAWRLQRGTVLGWTVGMFLAGLSFGSFGDDVGALVGDSAFSRDLFGGGQDVVLDAFYASSAAMLAVFAMGFTVSSALRPHGEETQGRVENVLTTALSRRRWLLGHLAVTVVGTSAVMLVCGLGLGLGFGLVTDGWDRFGPLVSACLLMVPALLVVGGVARGLYGWVPRVAPLAWLAVLFCAVVMFFGDLLDLPRWLVAVSPLSHLGDYPAGPVEWPGVVAVTVVAAVLGAAGSAGFERRDVG